MGSKINILLQISQWFSKKVPTSALFLLKAPRLLLLRILQNLLRNFVDTPSISEGCKEACITKSGPDPGKPCIFPFRNCNSCSEHHGCDSYNSCATEVNSYGKYTKWGFCSDDCP